MAKYLTYNGEKHTIATWARIFRVNENSLRYRLAHGNWSDFELYFGKRSIERPTKYIQNKIRMLHNDFYINLTNEEMAHFYSLKTESAVDQYAHDIILNKL